jgi:hypothetical protein
MISRKQKRDAFFQGMLSVYDIAPIDKLPIKKKEPVVLPEIGFEKAWENVGETLYSVIESYEKELTR